MNKILAFLFCSVFCLLTPFSVAQETADANENTKVESTQAEKQQKQNELLAIEPTPQVGKHVMANMDASSMILSLLMVLALIIISALVLKRFNLTQQSSNQLKVVASLPLGAKERILVVQIGEEQLVLGVSSQQISLLKSLEKPIDIQLGKPLALSGNVLSFLQKSIKNETESNSNSATSETTRNK